MTKVKVIEVEAIKLDPNAKYLIVFSELQLDMARMIALAQQLTAQGIEAVFTQAKDPEKALKVYQIPNQKKAK